MLYIESNNVIRLTRGDTAKLTVPIENDLDNSSYVMDELDTLTFTIKKSVKDNGNLVQKVVTGSNNFHIKPEDTNSLPFGKYVYDVQLTTAGGDVYTVIEPTSFEILSEVT